MKCIINKLRQRRGDAKLIHGMLIIGIMCLMALLLMELMNVLSTVKLVRDSLDHAVLAAAADNAPDAFGGIREGNSGVWQYKDGSAPVMSYRDMLSSEDVERRLLETGPGDLVKEGSALVRYDRSGQLVFRISSVSVHCENPPPDGSSGSSCRISASCKLYIPMYFLRLDAGPTVTVEISSRFLPRF